MAPEEETSEDDLGDNIEHSIKDSLGVRVDDISTLRQAPSDGVEPPKEQEQLRYLR